MPSSCPASTGARAIFIANRCSRSQQGGVLSAGSRQTRSAARLRRSRRALCDGQIAGIPKDLAESVKWYKRAADLGIGRAAAALGAMTLRGEGMPRDPRQRKRISSGRKSWDLTWMNICSASGCSGRRSHIVARVSQRVARTRADDRLRDTRDGFPGYRFAHPGYALFRAVQDVRGGAPATPLYAAAARAVSCAIRMSLAVFKARRM